MTVTMYLTDKTGKRLWETHCGAGYSGGERRNLEGHLARIKAGHKAYAKVEIDRESARLIDENDVPDFSPEAMLAWATQA